jgi:hypothetical protein
MGSANRHIAVREGSQQGLFGLSTVEEATAGKETQERRRRR